MAEAKNCHFCGGASNVASCGFDAWQVVCLVCHAEGVRKQTREMAIDAWDRRTPKADQVSPQPVARYKSEFADHLGAINAWVRQWEASGVSRAPAIHKACNELDRLHWELAVAEPYVRWTDKWDCQHVMSLDSAARMLREYYDEWPGGLEEIESALRTAVDPQPVGSDEELLGKQVWFDRKDVLRLLGLRSKGAAP